MASSTSSSAPSASDGTRKPFGEIYEEWVILTKTALSKCFYFPGKGGYAFISSFKFPEKI